MASGKNWSESSSSRHGVIGCHGNLFFGKSRWHRALLDDALGCCDCRQRVGSQGDINAGEITDGNLGWALSNPKHSKENIKYHCWQGHVPEYPDLRLLLSLPKPLAAGR